MASPFDAQYNGCYAARLATLRPAILSAAGCDAPGAVPIAVQDVPAASNTEPSAGTAAQEALTAPESVPECLVIAVFFLCSALKPSILEDTAAIASGTRSAASADKQRVQAATYMSADARFFMEDGTGKLEVCFAPECRRPYALLTGMVLGFIGRKDQRGVFLCSAVVYPGTPAITPLPVAAPAERSQILLVASPAARPAAAARLHALAGALRGALAAVVVVGELAADTQALQEPPGTTTATAAHPDTPAVAPRTASGFAYLAAWVSALTVPVHIVPCLADPTTQALPQRPLHPLLFGTAGAPGNARLEGNPAAFTAAGIRIVALSGALLADMARYVPQNGACVQFEAEDYRMHLATEALKDYVPRTRTTAADTLDMLAFLLKLRHAVPVAPDTLACVPYAETDPFHIAACDLLVGVGAEFAARREDACAVVVPRLAESGCAVLYDVAQGRATPIEVVDK